ncbi:jun-like transcription factor [Coemansia sp. RSA 2603]|nr:jun-like transcription factor [Coemansia sp. RSA 2603]
MVKKAQVSDLVKAHALLVDSGLETAVTTLVAESAQVGKKNKVVQGFLESVVVKKEKSKDKKRLVKKESSSSDSESSSSSDSDSSSSSNSSSSDSDPSSSSSSSDSDSSSSDSDSSSSSSSSSASESVADTSATNKSENDDTPSKKRKASTEILGKHTGEPAKNKADINTNRPAKRGEANDGPKVPFCRIRPEDVVYADERLKDNRYMAKGGVENDFGYKAHRDLIVTRGKGFTKEKNKKKRGSYSGGKITMVSHSIKFD